jgi:hypothetical protein
MVVVGLVYPDKDVIFRYKKENNNALKSIDQQLGWWNR